VFEVRGVVHTRREHDDSGLFASARRAGSKCLQQVAGVFGDRPDPMTGEQLRKDMGHRSAVLDHIGDPGRSTKVVLEDAVAAVLIANQIDAGDVDADAVRRIDPTGISMEVGRRQDEPAGQDAVRQHLRRTIDIGEERLQRANPLDDTRLDELPFQRRDDTRYQVERKRALLPGQ
jgi:hypothetical protein